MTESLRHTYFTLPRLLVVLALIGLASIPSQLRSGRTGDRTCCWRSPTTSRGRTRRRRATRRSARRRSTGWPGRASGSPMRSPARRDAAPAAAALLTGRQHWQVEQAGTHASSFPTTYVTYPDLLEQAGYVVGYTGKAWGPGNWKVSGRKRNPAGPDFNERTLDPPFEGISKEDYAANFADFLARRPRTSRSASGTADTSRTASTRRARA